ncbi:MAG: hypothetical protein U0234_00255 [Sandaracinus sp.]
MQPARHAWGLPETLRLLAELPRAMALAPPAFRESMVLRTGIERQIPQIIEELYVAREAVRRVRPRAVVVGNVTTPDGRALVRAAREVGAPVFAIQHGHLEIRDPTWDRADFDRMLLWGEVSRDVLVARGIPRERLLVVGAPWLDAVPVHEGPTYPPTQPTALLALSGAGHSVGLAEHRAIVGRVIEAARELPSLRWNVRVHRKDDPRLYEPLRALGARVEQIGERRPIALDLAEAHVLVTVGSTTALDAMLADVPALTLARENGDEAGYVDAGGVVKVEVGASLARALTEVVQTGAPETRARARQYVGRYFGRRDGRAAHRSVEALLPSLTSERARSERSESRSPA